MQIYDGVLTSASPLTAPAQGPMYPTIHIAGGTMLPRIRVFQDLGGPLAHAVSTARPVKLYIKHKTLCGLTLADGQTFRSEMVRTTGLYLGMGAAAFLGLITLPLLGMG